MLENRWKEVKQENVVPPGPRTVLGKWLAALRSGLHTQCFGYFHRAVLRTENEWLRLGVSGVVMTGSRTVQGDAYCALGLLRVVSDAPGFLGNFFPEELQQRVLRWNDMDRLPFPEIADRAEAWLRSQGVDCS